MNNQICIAIYRIRALSFAVLVCLLIGPLKASAQSSHWDGSWRFEGGQLVFEEPQALPSLPAPSDETLDIGTKPPLDEAWWELADLSCYDDIENTRDPNSLDRLRSDLRLFFLDGYGQSIDPADGERFRDAQVLCFSWEHFNRSGIIPDHFTGVFGHQIDQGIEGFMRNGTLGSLVFIGVSITF